MKKTLLCGALLGVLGLAQTAMAQEFDDRWYVSGDLGVLLFDGDRDIHDDALYSIGFGKMFAPNWSWEVNLHSTNPNKNSNEHLNWSMWGAGMTGRYHFIREDNSWHPFLYFGAGALRAEEESINPNNGPPLQREDTNLEVHGGVGLQADYGRTALRGQLGMRYDFDDQSSIIDEDGFNDFVASVGVIVRLGAEPAPPVEPDPEPAPQPQTTCADMDDDGDGVNNCDDKCPNSTAGQTIGEDGCPRDITIDLRGVNFDFDKDTLRPDSIATLDEAIAVLNQYPNLRVEVAGHTDECGKDGYNDDLSNRRARTVYDYLTGHGVDAGRLAGPNGYGESRPLEALGDAFPACKSETNRRTELNVEN